MKKKLEKAELATGEGQNARSSKESNAIINKLQTEIERLTSQCEAAEKARIAMERTNEELESKQRIQEATTENLQSKLDEGLEENVFLRQEIEDKSEELAGFRKQVAELRYSAELAERERGGGGGEENRAYASDSTTPTIGDDSELAEKEKKIAELEQLVKDDAELIAALEAEIKEKNEALEASEQQCGELNEEIERMIDEMTTTSNANATVAVAGCGTGTLEGEEGGVKRSERIVELEKALEKKDEEMLTMADQIAEGAASLEEIEELNKVIEDLTAQLQVSEPALSTSMHTNMFTVM